MLIIILLFILFIIGMFWSFRNWNDVLFVICLPGAFITLVLGVAWISTSVDCHFGESTYTGYIYSVTKEGFGRRTVGHLRFSENAGEDNQPSFCVKEEDAVELRSLAGSGKKVRVTVPDAGIVFGEPLTCKIPAIVEEVE